MHGLSDSKVSELSPRPKPYKRADGHGLYIYVTPGGSRLWRMNYRFLDRQKTLSFGAWPITTLDEARSKCVEARRLLQAGRDPALGADPAPRQRRKARTGTFDALADELLAKRESDGLSPVTLDKKRWLLGFARPGLGPLEVRDIRPADILEILKDVEARGTHETAKRLRTTIGEVFRYAIATLRAETDPTQVLRGALIRPSVRHMPALVEEGEFARLVRALWAYDGRSQAVLALRLMVLMFPRPGELRHARWDEFDLDLGTWEISPERMKMRRPHRKPLSGVVCRALENLRADSRGSNYLFASQRSLSRPISENTMNSALRRLGYPGEQATPHGFRASASSLLNESGLWNPDAIEAELAHHDTRSVRSIYNRSAYWEERQRMMDWWSQKVLGMTNYRP